MRLALAASLKLVGMSSSVCCAGLQASTRTSNQSFDKTFDIFLIYLHWISRCCPVTVARITPIKWPPLRRDRLAKANISRVLNLFSVAV